MGRALARLPDLPQPEGVVPTLDAHAFGREHAARVRELGDRLAPLHESIPDAERLVSPPVPAPRGLILTHGDPGPGNYLDDGRVGTVIDWEEAQIAPQGLDLARLVFIAHLGSGPAGYVATDQQARADAATRGYLDGLSIPWRPTREELRWWLAVAGIQFVHHRWRDPGPGSWEQALDTLLDLLAHPSMS